jgi:hypothetical protein
MSVAYENVDALTTIVWSFAFGGLLGWFRRHDVAGLALSFPALVAGLHLVNIVGDTLVDSSRHNLLPFEFVILGVLLGPSTPGILLGAYLRRRRLRRESAPCLGDAPK